MVGAVLVEAEYITKTDGITDLADFVCQKCLQIFTAFRRFCPAQMNKRYFRALSKLTREFKICLANKFVQ